LRKIFISFPLNIYNPLTLATPLLPGEPLVSDYNLIPKHELLSESEMKSIAKKFNVSPDRFPKILESDPQAVRLKARPGQLIAIHRNDGTGEYLYYRYVVKG
jgi:DNA-directed RNA polymerase subunit H